MEHTHEKTESAKRPRSGFQAAPIVCMIEDCGVDLSESKDYHQRHKVCEKHARATTCEHKGQIMRFCQQCSRFHPLKEFDDGKRSCRRRLLGHNKRRRKKDDGSNEADEKAVALHNAHATLSATVDLSYNTQEEIHRRIEEASADRTPARKLGQGLSLSPFSPHDASPDGDGPSLALSQFLRNAHLPQRAPESTLSSVLLGSPPHTTDFLGRSLGLSANQQLLFNLQNQRHIEQGPKVEPGNAMQLHFPTTSPSDILRAAGVRQSPSLQQLLDKAAPNHNLNNNQNHHLNNNHNHNLTNNHNQANASHHSLPGTGMSSLFPLPNSVPLGSEAQWNGQTLEGLVDGARMGVNRIHHMPGGYLPMDRTGRISFKLFDKNPNDLPDDLRDQILDWLQRRPSAMETYLRPGCVLVALYIAMPQQDWEALERNWAVCLGSLMRTQSWASGRFHAFIGDTMAYVDRGVVQKVQPVADLQGPVIDRVLPRCLVAGQPVKMTIKGRGLLHPDNRIVCLHDGQRFLDSRLGADPSEMDATQSDDDNTRSRSSDVTKDEGRSAKRLRPRSGLKWSPRSGGAVMGKSRWSRDPLTGQETLEWTMAAPPKGAQGTLFVEVDAIGLTSNTRPLLVTDDALCVELASLSQGLDESGPLGSASRSVAEAQMDALVHDLGWLLGKADHGNSSAKRAQVLAFATAQQWHCTAGRLRSVGAAKGEGLQRWGNKGDRACAITGDKTPAAFAVLAQSSGSMGLHHQASTAIQEPLNAGHVSVQSAESFVARPEHPPARFSVQSRLVWGSVSGKVYPTKGVKSVRATRSSPWTWGIEATRSLITWASAAAVTGTLMCLSWIAPV